MMRVPPFAELVVLSTLFCGVFVGETTLDIAGSMVYEQRSLSEAIQLACSTQGGRYTDEELSSPFTTETSVSWRSP